MATTKNDRENPQNGAVNWTAITDEAHTVELHTDKNLYGFWLAEYPQSGSLTVRDVSTGAATGAELTVISTGVPQSGQCYPDVRSKSCWVWCHADQVGYAVECDYSGGGTGFHEENITTLIDIAGLGDLADLNAGLDNSTAVAAINSVDDKVTALTPEFVYNSDLSNADDTTSFATGSGGSLVPSVASTAKKKRVRFSQAYQFYILQVNENGTGPWLDVGCTRYKITRRSGAGSGSDGMGYEPVSATDIDVLFTENGPYTVINSSTDTYNTWATEAGNGTKWRVAGFNLS